MKTCERCHVTVVGDFNKCPLCQHALIDDGFLHTRIVF